MSLPYTTTTTAILTHTAGQQSLTPETRSSQAEPNWRYWRGGVKHLKVCFEGYMNLLVSMGNWSCKALEKTVLSFPTHIQNSCHLFYSLFTQKTTFLYHCRPSFRVGVKVFPSVNYR